MTEQTEAGTGFITAPKTFGFDIVHRWVNGLSKFFIHFMGNCLNSVHQLGFTNFLPLVAQLKTT